MLGRHQPGQQGCTQADAFAGFGKGVLGGDETAVQLGQRQRPVEALDTPGEGATASIAVSAPDLVEDHAQLILGEHLRAAEQAPEQPGTVGHRQVADDTQPWLGVTAQALGRIDETAHPATTRRDIEQHLHPFQR